MRSSVFWGIFIIVVVLYCIPNYVHISYEMNDPIIQQGLFLHSQSNELSSNMNGPFYGQGF